MKTSSQAIKVGITVLFTVLCGFLAFKFVHKGIDQRSDFQVWMLFRDASGLVDKSRVQIAGLTIGEIGKRELLGARAKITVKLQKGTILYSNAVVYKKAASLLGEFYLEIDPGTPQSPNAQGQLTDNRQLVDGDQILSVVEAVTVADVLLQVQETLPVLKDILRDVREVTKGPLPEVVASVKTAIDRNSVAAETMLKHIDDIALDLRQITAGQSQRDIKDTISNIKDISQGLKGVLGTGKGEMENTNAKLQNTMDKIGRAADKLDQTLANTLTITDRVKAGEGTVGRLLHDETIATNVEGITEDVGGFLRSITKLQTLIGLRSEYNIQSNTLKTYVAVQIQSRPDKFFYVELIDDPRGSRTTERSVTTTDDPTKPQTTNTETIKVNDKFRFSFMLGKRMFLLKNHLILTGRFGIKESTGGLGADIDLPFSITSRWFRNLRITADIFDFRTNTYPRLKIMAALEFFKHMWIVGGVDDVLNARGPGVGNLTGRDYFFGIMLTFNDEDLRGLLAVGGAALLGGAR